MKQSLVVAIGFDDNVDTSWQESDKAGEVVGTEDARQGSSTQRRIDQGQFMGVVTVEGAYHLV